MLWNADGEKLAIGVREPDGYKGKVQTTQWGTWPTFESWNWPGHEGKDITVEVYSRYPEVALYLDGKFIGKKPPEAMMASFTLPYTPGTLRAVGIEDGKDIENIELATAGPVADIRDNEPYFDNTQKTWHGRAMAVVRSTGRPGYGTITVATPSLSKILEIKCSQHQSPEGTEKRPSILQ